MVRTGKNVVLMRDLTDTMYNPASEPFVSHFTGTDLIVEHIEKWVCATVTSDQIIGGQPFQFKNDKRPHLAILMAEREYKTAETLPAFALEYLGKTFRMSYVFANEYERNDLPGVDILNDADVAIISVRRRVLPEVQLKTIRSFVACGKPVVGVRTANHAFSLRGTDPPEGNVAWEEFDRDVIGGNYTGHHGGGPKVSIETVIGSDKHPILKGVDVANLCGSGSLYKVGPIADSTTELLRGSIPGKPDEPIAWINTSEFGGRVFYTSLAHPDDFSQPAFNRLLRNAIFWAAGLLTSTESSTE